MVKDMTIKAKQKENHDTHHGARTLPPLVPIEGVSDRQSEVRVEQEVGSESFEVAPSDGVYRRN